MKLSIQILVAALLVTLVAMVAVAQPVRQDAIWARTSTSPITVDGVLNEAVWAVAESVQVQFGQNAGYPGSGFHFEGTPAPSDPTDATLKFLVWGDSLYVAVTVKDSSVGGAGFNRKDAFLMNIRTKAPTGSPGVFINSLYSRSFEYFYGWWDADAASLAVGADPSYFGPAGGHRDSIQAANSTYPEIGGLVKRVIWDAVTTVQGVANSDTTSGGAPAYDEGYTVELKYNLALRGYDLTSVGGEIVMYSISIYDGDWRWPIDSNKTTGNRVWLQAPFGGAAQYGHMNLLVDPSVTTSTPGPLPNHPIDHTIANGENYASPVIDGTLDEEVWVHAPVIHMEYGNETLRNSYPFTGKYRSGQYQLPISGATAPILDASPAMVKYFFKNDMLYFGFDVADQVVSFRPAADHRDGFRLTFNDRTLLHSSNNNLFVWDIRFYVDTVDHGAGRGRAGYLQNTLQLDTLGAIQLALQLKPNTTVDTLATNPEQVDEGFTAELAIDLTKFGYPAGRGDGVVFFGITHYDGDFIDPIENSYSIRTWYFRELNDLDGPVYSYMDPTEIITSVGDDLTGLLPDRFEVRGNYPNPFNPTTVIEYSMPEAGHVTLQVFDVLGRKVATERTGHQLPGVRSMTFAPQGLSSGTYFYYLELATAAGNKVGRTSTGKMLFVK